MLAHGRRIILLMLPLGAFTGWMMGLGVSAYIATFEWIQRHWIQCLGSGRETETSGHDNLKTFALVEAAYASAASGGFVTLAAVA